MTLRTIAAALLAFALSAGAAAAQPAQGLKDQIVGSWNFVVAEVKASDGSKTFPFGETPKGILIFTAEGRFAQIHVAGDVPKIASKQPPDRHTGRIRRDHAAQPVGVRHLYGRRDQKDRHLQHRLRFIPELEGEAQTRTIDKLTADEFVNTNPRHALHCGVCVSRRRAARAFSP